MPAVPADLHLHEPRARGLTRLGWDLDEPAVRAVAPVLARGNNMILALPPAPAYAAPALAGVLSCDTGSDAITLVLCPGPSLAEWTHQVRALAGETGLAALVVRASTMAGSTLRARDGGPLLVITDPERCGELLGLAALDAGRVGAVLVAWPEHWDPASPGLADLLQDVSREAQRVVLTSDPAAVAELVQRHAWRAVTVGEPPREPIAPARTVVLGWHRRVSALPDVLSALGPGTAAVWTADTSLHEAIRSALAGLGQRVEVTRGTPAGAAHIVAFDPPTGAHFAALAAAGEVTLLTPPGTERWAQALASPRRPLLLPGDPAVAGGDAARRRRVIARLLEGGTPEEGLRALAPLFETHEPTLVAAALYQAWRAGGEPPPPAQAPASSAARVWVNAGRKDEVGPHDLVGLLVNELRLDRAAIGRIELRETFSLVEVPAEDAGRIATALTGRTLRRRRLIARVDTGAPRRPHRGGP